MRFAIVIKILGDDSGLRLLASKTQSYNGHIFYIMVVIYPARSTRRIEGTVFPTLVRGWCGFANVRTANRRTLNDGFD